VNVESPRAIGDPTAQAGGDADIELNELDLHHCTDTVCGRTQNQGFLLQR